MQLLFKKFCCLILKYIEFSNKVLNFLRRIKKFLMIFFKCVRYIIRFMAEDNAKEREQNSETDYEELTTKILDAVNGLTSSGFEQLVIDLLIKMGYEVFRNAKRRNGLFSIHALILEDRPGFHPLYVQMRKLERGSIITSWNMHGFSDAISRKGAQDFAKEHKMILIDGNILARLMITNNFCVNIKEVVQIKSINTDALENYS